ncbi:uncharacterized protein [Diadema antillarum]|uniref:uncharacterized protein n=1 Tax=Diadema antillarum TaxID=105358 RepID=UPI003A8BAC8A
MHLQTDDTGEVVDSAISLDLPVDAFRNGCRHECFVGALRRPSYRLRQLADYFEIGWGQDNYDISTRTVEQEMCANVYQNGVLFGLWAAGVAISVGRLLTYIIVGDRARKDVQTQTDDIVKEQCEVPVEIEHGVQEEVEKIPLEEDDKTSESNAEKDESEDESVASRQNIVDAPTMDKEETKELKSKTLSPEIKADLDEKRDDETLTDDKRISVYKLPAIKKHHFLVRQDGMRVLRQAVQGDFSLEKVSLEGIRNFLFIVAKGSPSQLAELEAKIKADYRWLTPVRTPSRKLTGDLPIQGSQVTTLHEATRIPARPLRRAQTPGLTPGHIYKTPNPNPPN